MRLAERLRVTLRRHRGSSARDARNGPPPPSQELIDFASQLGVALCQSGEATDRVTLQLETLVESYGAEGVRFFALPTGVFVRVGSGTAARVDFERGNGDTYRLDQISAIYALYQDALHTGLPPSEGIRRLARIRHTERRFSPMNTVIGHGVLIVGLGLMSDPVPWALLCFAVLGLVVGGLRLLAERFTVLSLALPVSAAILVTVVVFQLNVFLPVGNPALLLIPPLVTFLPGAALTIGTLELATGSIVSGAARLMSGVVILFLLSFGILVGLHIVDLEQKTSGGDRLGWWSPWVGVLLLGIGFFVHFSAPRRTLGWLLLVLYAIWVAQLAGTHLGGSLLGAFLGGLVITPITYFLQGHTNAPPAQVMFLPAFWMLVPGAVGLAGVSKVVTTTGAGVSDIVNALLTVVAIALGVLVGSSFTQSALRPTMPAEVADRKVRRRYDLGHASDHPGEHGGQDEPSDPGDPVPPQRSSSDADGQ